MDTTLPPAPRFLYVAACYDRRESSAYHLLVISDEEHDPEADAGAAAIIRLLAQASERRDWFVGDDAFRDEVRLAHRRIGDELHELSRYALAVVLGWTPITTDARIWDDGSR